MWGWHSAWPIRNCHNGGFHCVRAAEPEYGGPCEAVRPLLLKTEVQERNSCSEGRPRASAAPALSLHGESQASHAEEAGSPAFPLLPGESGSWPPGQHLHLDWSPGAGLGALTQVLLSFGESGAASGTPGPLPSVLTCPEADPGEHGGGAPLSAGPAPAQRPCPVIRPWPRTQGPASACCRRRGRVVFGQTGDGRACLW